MTGAQIQAAQIPFLPQGAQIIQAWFAPLPLSATTYYIPYAILAASPVSIGYDPSTGSTPSVGTGIVFAFNPCSQEYHFGIQVSAQLLGRPSSHVRRPGETLPRL